MKNIILSVLFWAVASVCLAIKLPSSSYSGSGVDYDNSFNSTFTIGSRSITGIYLSAAAYGGECASATVDNMAQCCTDLLSSTYGISLNQATAQYYGGGDKEPLEFYNNWMSGNTSLPLGSPLLLLPFALVYALVRKRKEETL
jgi:hypothetical protein